MSAPLATRGRRRRRARAGGIESSNYQQNERKAGPSSPPSGVGAIPLNSGSRDSARRRLGKCARLVIGSSPIRSKIAESRRGVRPLSHTPAGMPGMRGGGRGVDYPSGGGRMLCANLGARRRAFIAIPPARIISTAPGILLAISAGARRPRRRDPPGPPPSDCPLNCETRADYCSARGGRLRVIKSN